MNSRTRNHQSEGEAESFFSFPPSPSEGWADTSKGLEQGPTREAGAIVNSGQRLTDYGGVVSLYDRPTTHQGEDTWKSSTKNKGTGGSFRSSTLSSNFASLSESQHIRSTSVSNPLPASHKINSGFPAHDSSIKNKNGLDASVGGHASSYSHVSDGISWKSREEGWEHEDDDDFHNPKMNIK